MMSTVPMAPNMEAPAPGLDGLPNSANVFIALQRLLAAGRQSPSVVAGEDADAMALASRGLAEFLIARRPALPCCILEVAPEDTPLVCSALASRGYQLQAVPAPMPLQPLGENIRGELVLLPQAAGGSDPLLLWAAAQDVLPPGGQLLWFDCFRLDPATEQEKGGRQLQDLIALASRFGFELIERLDCTAQAIAGLESVLAGANAPELAAWQQTLADFRAGSQGYFFLSFRKGDAAGWRLQAMDASQQEEMRALFAKVFGHEMPPALWQWKYGDGRGVGIGVWRDGQMVAHFGGLARTILVHGRQGEGVQIVDVMADARGRGGASRKGAFFHAAATFLERYVGEGKRFLCAYGFPNFRHMRVAAQQGLYEEVDRIAEVRWTALQGRPSLKTGLRAIAPDCDDPRLAGKIDVLWKAMAADLRESAVGVRDWHYIRHRYLRQPSLRYHLFLASRRFGGKPVGLLVARPQERVLLLLDVVAPLANLPEMIHHARRLAARLGLEGVRAWITASHLQPFLGQEELVQQTDIIVPTCRWCPNLPAEELRHQWWLTAGDTEFQ